jgi:Transcriptional regulator containing PAS, AAA-type ATPase, and DNA-binding domains
MEQKVAAPSPEVIRSLYKGGFIEEARLLEKKFGIDYTSIEKHLDTFITKNDECLRIKHMVRQLAVCDDCVLIQGETGTGKELLARALHGNKTGKFMDINCAGMPKELMESELFGHAAGSFSGAKGEKVGLITAANNGTVFLDEIGDLPLDTQAKFLRVIQERTLRKVGSNDNEPVTARFIAATHFNLKQLVEKAAFRRDLYARLSVFTISIPPLRDRLDDIPLIIEAKDSTGTFPTNKVNWGNVDLELNVRSIEHIIRRFIVLGELPHDNTTIQ